MNNHFMKFKDLYFKNNNENNKENDSQSKNVELITFLVNKFLPVCGKFINQMITAKKDLKWWMNHNSKVNKNYNNILVSYSIRKLECLIQIKIKNFIK